MADTRVSARRLDALAETIRARAHRGPTIGELPHGQEIARQLAIMLDSPAGTDQRDLAMMKAGALLTLSLGLGDPGCLDYIAQQEDATDSPDPGFWTAVGGGQSAMAWNDRECRKHVEDCGLPSNRNREVGGSR